MKKIYIISNYVNFEVDGGNSRFTYLAGLLNKEYDVTLITSSFIHGIKKHRDKSKYFNNGYKVVIAEEPGYKKNISFKRIYSHNVFSKNVIKKLNEMERPDIIYCAIPPLNLGKDIARFCEKFSIKFIIDIQDLWPEAFEMLFKIDFIPKLIFSSMKMKADYIYNKADGIVAVSETYALRAINNIKEKKWISVFLGTNLKKFDNYKISEKTIKSDEIIRLVYIGTLGHSYEIYSIMDAINILDNELRKQIKFLIMGTGPLENDFKLYAEKLNINVEFTGKLPYNEMVKRLCICDIAINPIRKKAAQSIINKVGDYAAAGLPVVNTQECEEYRNLIEEYNIGFNCINGDIVDISNKIKKLIDNPNLRKEMGKNNRKLAEDKFDRNKTYLNIVDFIKEFNI